jgi:hypothetical protein
MSELTYDDNLCWYCGDENITCGIIGIKNGKKVEVNFCSDKCRCECIKEHNKHKEPTKYIVMK